MSRPFLFGGQPSGHQSKYLVEFRAGKMTMRDNKVTPSSKKGLVYLNHGEDSLMHFCWKDRTTGAVEDDLIIFPDDAEFKRVPQCTTGRVYVLRFKTNSRRCFYWMQEPTSDRDDEFCRKVNEYLNNPPAPGSRANSSSSTLASVNNFSELGAEHDLQSLFNTVTPQQLMQMLTNVNGMSPPGMLSGLLNQSSSSRSSSSSNSKSSTTTSSSTPAATSSGSTSASSTTTAAASSSTTTGSTTPSGSSKLNNMPGIKDWQNILADLRAENTRSQSNSSSVPLNAVLNSQALNSLLGNSDFMNRVRDLLPESVDPEFSAELSEKLPEYVSSTFSSAQFQSALQTFHAAFQMGSLGPLMSQFNLSHACVEAAERGDLEGFVKAMEESEGEKKSKDNNEKDSDMALD